MKKNQTQIKKYAAVISIFLAAVIVGLFVFFFCIKRSVEQYGFDQVDHKTYRFLWDCIDRAKWGCSL